MKRPLLLRLVRRLMEHPAAPFFEAAVRDEVVRICRDYGLEYDVDPHGNVLAAVRTAPRQRPLVLAAHMDHPGFHVQPIRGGSLAAQFQGGVSSAHFKAGRRIRLHPGNLPARLGRKLTGDRRFEIDARIPAGAAPRFAVWDLEPFAVRAGRIHGRACDDLIGVATALAVLIELKQSRARVHVIAAISRAEEVGFHGALMLAKHCRLPHQSLVVSLETSRELPPVTMGHGVIIRVGDRSSTFGSAAMRFLVETAGALQKRSRGFRFQRALMSGGTCEATAYQEFGYETAAVCVALGNYHNCAPGHRIGAEFVSVEDAVGMGALLVEAARQMRNYAPLSRRLNQRLNTLAREASRSLRKFPLPGM